MTITEESKMTRNATIVTAVRTAASLKPVRDSGAAASVCFGSDGAVLGGASLGVMSLVSWIFSAAVAVWAAGSWLSAYSGCCSCILNFEVAIGEY